MQNRIKEFRKRANMSLAQMATITGISAQQLNRLEQGTRRLNTDNLAAIATALHRSPSELIAAQAKVPILGSVGAGDAVYPINDLPELPEFVNTADEDLINCEWVEAPPGALADGMAALKVTGQSMEPILKPGAVVYYSSRHMGEGTERCLERLCVVQTRDGKALVKIVKKSLYQGRFDLISTNQEIIPAVELAWCAPVIFIKPL